MYKGVVRQSLNSLGSKGTVSQVISLPFIPEKGLVLLIDGIDHKVEKVVYDVGKDRFLILFKTKEMTDDGWVKRMKHYEEKGWIRGSINPTEI